MRRSDYSPLLLYVVCAACDLEPKQIPTTARSSESTPAELKKAPGATPAEAAQSATPTAASIEIAPVSEWSRCSQGFHTGGDPVRDVVRLGLMCGPVTGMQAIGPEFHGKLSGSELVTVVVSLNRECVRLVAAANGAVADLELEVFSPNGSSLELANDGQSWALVPRDRPLCVDAAGWYRITLSTHGGDGEYALRILHQWPDSDTDHPKLRRSEQERRVP